MRCVPREAGNNRCCLTRAGGPVKSSRRGADLRGLALTLVLLAISLWPAAGAGRRPLPGEAGVRPALVLVAALVLVTVGAVHWRRWRLGLDSMQLALVVACLLSAGALLSLQVGRPWHLAWCYLTAWPPDRALHHLEAGRGTHFDPQCLDAFLAMMAERGHRPAHRPDDVIPAEDACHEQPQAPAIG